MRINLTKKEIINAIHMQIGYSKKISEIIFEDFFDILLENIIKNKSVKLSKFGTFYLKRKKERIGRNPKTKDTAIISERNVITFKSSKELKYLINKSD
ncbi:MAG: integration host factor subunit alpha [Candidatus Pelagibacter sp. TMED118]|nr:MAG: integration host factor subunit alpha [Candidatus Pelagibacter sp. TMED118]|tara:strand:- start:28 stop:321 length:294 start_codon:yes stop_codon:yes gene_type:complete